MSGKPVSRALLAIILASQAGAQTLTHRWSFNQPAGAAPTGTTLADSISASSAVVRGINATFTGTALTLPGTTDGEQTPAATAGYIDLPNGILSSRTDFTVEIWATVLSYKPFQRLFDFGRVVQSGNGAPGEITGLGTTASGTTQASDDFMLALSRNGSTISQQRFAGKLDDAESFIDSNTATTAGTQYHFAATYQAGVGALAATGGRMSWYRNGTLISSLDVPFRLSQIEDVNNWLGRSQWSGDSNSNISYDEVRLYSGALTAADLAASRTAGPNVTAPSAQPDAATVLRNGKISIPAAANDTGGAFASSVEIVTPPTGGTAVVKPGGRILYTQTNSAAAADSLTYRIGGGGGFSSPATVTISIANGLRIPNNALNVPATPPPTAIALVNAFPGVTLANPTCLATPPGETKRLFVCLKGGTIRVIPDVTQGTPSSSQFLTIANVDTGSECGVLGIAFHPAYATNRHFYVFYSVTVATLRYERVSRFTTSAGDPNFADPATELVLLQQRDEANNHNGGDLHFGPDGYLYITLGDEGAQDDSFDNSQRINKDFFSGLLRIDVNLEAAEIPGGDPAAADDANRVPQSHPSVVLTGGLPSYEIPVDNPFVHTTRGGAWTGSFNGSPIANLAAVRDEFWAVGLRNPWRMSFDAGEIWLGDVGGNNFEEVNIIEKGRNYGWVYREGKMPGPRGDLTPPANFTTLYGTDPIYDYSHGGGTFQGASITGGLVYRGTRVPSLTGKYIFADYVSGNIWSLQRNGAAPPTVLRIAGENGISAFGRDPSNGDLLLADENGARILRLSTTAETSGYPLTLGATGLFADLADLAPAPGMVPYSVNLPFWSDHAEKRRWMVVPDGTSDFTWSRDGIWTTPTGTIWVKHFDMRMQRENPASLKRIETRVLVKNAGGAYGVSYRWNDGGTEATLAADGGEEFPLAITENGTPVPQTWQIPSRAACMTCHTPQAGHALSFNTRQLNAPGDLSGFTGNQLTVLHQQGFFTNDPGSPNLLPRHVRENETDFSEEARARSYLAVNCSYCHMAGGTGLGNFDARHELTLAQTGMVNGNASNNGGDPLNKLLVPGEPARSIILNRTAASNGFTRMPPLGTRVIDAVNVALITRWIDGELDDRMTYEEWRTLEFGADPDGDPGDDPDGDGVINSDEYLAGTFPKSGASALRPQTSVAGGNVKLSFNLPVNRSFLIRTSTDLQTWTPWDIPGNQGLPVKGGLTEITRPIEPPQRFFRVEIRDN